MALKDISTSDAKKLLQTPNAIVLDVRTKEEFDSGHIQNALNIDFFSSAFEKEIEKLDKSKAYLIVCKSGNRSKLAQKIMAKLGFENTQNVSGGRDNWKN